MACPISSTSYKLKGALATSNGVYAKRHLFGNDGECVPDLAGGSGASSTTYLCDCFYIQLASTHVLACGGSAPYGSNVGLGSANVVNGFLITSVGIGSRLCYFPF